MDKLRRTIVISMDHVELGMPGGDGVYPPATGRLRLMARDAWDMVLDRLARDPRADRQRRLQRATNGGGRNQSYVAYKWKALTAAKGTSGAYRPDGSRDECERGEQPANLEFP